MVLAAFAYLNGMSPWLFSKLIWLNDSCNWKRHDQCMKIFEYFDRARVQVNYQAQTTEREFDIRSRYWSFCIHHNRVENLNHQSKNFPSTFQSEEEYHAIRKNITQQTGLDLFCSDYLRNQVDNA